MTRQQAQERLLDYLYGELPDPERAEVEAWLARDAELQAELHDMGGVKAAFDAVPMVHMPASLHDALMQQAQQHVSAVVLLDPEPEPLVAPRSTAKVQRAPWWERIVELLFQPAFATAMAMVLVAGIGLYVTKKGVVDEHEPRYNDSMPMGPALSAPKREARESRPSPTEPPAAEKDRTLATSDVPPSASTSSTVSSRGGATGKDAPTLVPPVGGMAGGEAAGAPAEAVGAVALAPATAEGRANSLSNEPGVQTDGSRMRGGLDSDERKLAIPAAKGAQATAGAGGMASGLGKVATARPEPEAPSLAKKTGDDPDGWVATQKTKRVQAGDDGTDGDVARREINMADKQERWGANAAPRASSALDADEVAEKPSANAEGTSLLADSGSLRLDSAGASPPGNVDNGLDLLRDGRSAQASAAPQPSDRVAPPPPRAQDVAKASAAASTDDESPAHAELRGYAGATESTVGTPTEAPLQEEAEKEDHYQQARAERAPLQAQSSGPKGDANLESTADSLAASGEYTAAAATYRKAIDRGADAMRVRLKLAKVLLASGDVAGAEAELAKVGTAGARQGEVEALEAQIVTRKAQAAKKASKAAEEPAGAAKPASIPSAPAFDFEYSDDDAPAAPAEPAAPSKK